MSPSLRHNQNFCTKELCLYSYFINIFRFMLWPRKTHETENHELSPSFIPTSPWLNIKDRACSYKVCSTEIIPALVFILAKMLWSAAQGWKPNFHKSLKYFCKYFITFHPRNTWDGRGAQMTQGFDETFSLGRLFINSSNSGIFLNNGNWTVVWVHICPILSKS